MGYFKKCCIPGCKSTAESMLMFKFPSQKPLSKCWESILRRAFPDIKLTRSRSGLCQQWCCILHFERKYLHMGSRKTKFAIPTLFTESEIESRMPDHPYTLGWINPRPGDQTTIRCKIDSNPAFASTLHDHLYCQNNVMFCTNNIEDVENFNDEISKETNEGMDVEIYKQLDEEIQDVKYEKRSEEEMVEETQETIYVEEINDEMNERIFSEYTKDLKTEICVKEEHKNEYSEEKNKGINGKLDKDEYSNKIYEGSCKEEHIEIYGQLLNRRYDEETNKNVNSCKRNIKMNVELHKDEYDDEIIEGSCNEIHEEINGQLHERMYDEVINQEVEEDTQEEMKKDSTNVLNTKLLEPDIYDPKDRIKKKFINIFSGHYCGLCIDSCDDLEPVTAELDISGMRQAITIRYVANMVFHNEDVLASEYVCNSCLDKLIQSFTFIYNTKTAHEILSVHVRNLTENITTCSKKTFPDLENLAILLDSTDITKHTPEINLDDMPTTESAQSIDEENYHACTQCDEILTTQEQLQKDDETKHLKRTKKCSKVVYIKEYYLALQAAVRCQHCSVQFPESDIKEHLRNMHAGLELECDYCDDVHYDRNSLDTHVRSNE